MENKNLTTLEDNISSAFDKYRTEEWIWNTDWWTLWWDVSKTFIKHCMNFFDRKNPRIINEICKVFVLNNINRFIDIWAKEKIDNISFETNEYWDFCIKYIDWDSEMYSYERNVLPELLKWLKI